MLTVTKIRGKCHQASTEEEKKEKIQLSEGAGQRQEEISRGEKRKVEDGGDRPSGYC